MNLSGSNLDQESLKSGVQVVSICHPTAYPSNPPIQVVSGILHMPTPLPCESPDTILGCSVLDPSCFRTWDGKDCHRPSQFVQTERPGHRTSSTFDLDW